MILVTGCSVFPIRSERSHLMEADEALQSGELYRARKLTRLALDENPEDFAAQMKMAEILNEEIVRYKKVFDEGAGGGEDLEKAWDEDRKDQVKTWLERSRGYLNAKSYDEALGAAEQVFTLDPENIKASELVDEIRKKALAEGKQDSDFLKNMYRGEMTERTARYKLQARKAMDRGEWGTARLSVQKALLLIPEDGEARSLLKAVDEGEKAGSREA